MVFQKGGRFPQETFSFNGEDLENLRRFNYLGYVVRSEGTIQKSINLLADKAVRAMGLLFSTIRHIQVPFKMLLQLSDTYVKSILNYSCETCGFSSAVRCESVHRKFLKRILDVRMSTNNMAVYGETGRFPLSLDRYIRITKYWLKLSNSDYNNCIVKAVYLSLKEEMEKNVNSVNWVSKIKT